MESYIDYCLTHEQLEEAWGSKLPKASEKGYPPLFDDMVYWVLYEGDEAVAYTATLTMPDRKFVLVGNTYVRKDYRGKGLHKVILNLRNSAKHLLGLPKLTIVNPIEETARESLHDTIISLGYVKVLHRMGFIEPQFWDMVKEYDVWCLL
tara:strand:+ start:6272 stop:6721 length:450 start_codon:yes stop_codon:yes gene_type:complete